jgi:hypothetical protein
VFVLGFSGCGLLGGDEPGTENPGTTPPADVTGLAGTPGDKQVVLSWTDPADGDLDHIEITWTPDGTDPRTVNKGTKTYTATGLTNGTPYTFTVKAVNTAGKGNTGATVTNTPAATGNLVSNPDNLAGKNIKLKFKGSEDKTGTAGVKAAFEELSAFIKKDGLTNGKTQNVIKLGDYIDLEGGLEVLAYPGDGGDGGGDFNYDGTSEYTRLIVVGINSFQPKSPNQYQYQGKDTPPPHVVFQFQNAPVARRMNQDDTNAGGYPASEMRKYLTPVTGVSGSGNFLAGLNNAGVPKGVLWEPARVMVAKKENPNETETIHDLLWLPTEYEMFGKLEEPASEEPEATQVQLAYYTDAKKTNNKLYKARKTEEYLGFPVMGENDSPPYWLASAVKDPNTKAFCEVNINTGISPIGAKSVCSVVPAFCVYGGQ